MNFNTSNTASLCSTFFLVLILLISCIREEFDPSKFDGSLNLKPGVAVPVGYSHLNIARFLGDSAYSSQLRIDDDGFLSLYYSKSVVSGTMGDQLTFPPISVNSTLLNTTGSDIDLLLPGASLDLSHTIAVPVTLAETSARLDSIHLLSGVLQVNISSANITGTITYLIPGLILNGLPYTITRNISNPLLTLNLAGYTIIPDHDLAGNNLLTCLLSVHLQNPSGPVAEGGDILTVQAGLNSLNYSTIFGNFSGFNIDLPHFSFATDFFNKIDAGSIEFADPRLKLLFSNSVGVPLSLSFNSFESSDRNNNLIPLTGAGVPSGANPKMINYPSLSQIGQVIEDSLLLDRTNSNLPVLFASNPDSIRMSVTAGINPAGGTGTTFINHDSNYDVTAVVDLPLWGKGEFLIMFDTLNFDFINSTIPAPEELERLIVRTNITNSFPVAMNAQIYMLDQNKVLLDSLFTQAITIEGAADINGDGLTDPHAQDAIDVDLPRNKIEMLNTTRFLVTKGWIATTDYPLKDVKFYIYQYLDFNIGLIAQLKINTGK
jgi:hypothetical protein